MFRVCCAFMFVLCAVPARGQDGASLYALHCGRCHDLGLPRTPSRRVLNELAPERVVAALETGTMRTQGAQRTADERRAIAAFLTGKAVGETPAPPTLSMCTSPASTSAVGLRWNGWGLSLANDRYQGEAGARLSANDVPRLKVKWAFGFAGDASAAVQPSVVGDRVFVASVPGRVYALSLKEGCAYWTFDADTMVRTAVVVGDADGGVQAAFFGDVAGNVYSVNAATGALRWRRHVDAHPVARVTGTPALFEGRLYVPVSSVEEVVGADPKYSCCTFRGSVVALDAANGEVVWKS